MSVSCGAVMGWRVSLVSISQCHRSAAVPEPRGEGADPGSVLAWSGPPLRSPVFFPVSVDHINCYWNALASRSSTAWSKLSSRHISWGLCGHEAPTRFGGAAIGQQMPEIPSADCSELGARSPRFDRALPALTATRTGGQIGSLNRG